VLTLALAIACSSPAKLAGQGGDCYVSTDCQEGLVCIPATAMCGNQAHKCSSDLSCIMSMLDSGGDAAMMMMGDGGTPKDGAPPMDSSPQDTGMGQDMGMMQDVMPPMDTGSPDMGVQDTGGQMDTGGGG
jgi:hypothetical protein